MQREKKKRDSHSKETRKEGESELTKEKKTPSRGPRLSEKNEKVVKMREQAKKLGVWGPDKYKKKGKIFKSVEVDRNDCRPNSIFLKDQFQDRCKGTRLPKGDAAKKKGEPVPRAQRDKKPRRRPGAGKEVPRGFL